MYDKDSSGAIDLEEMVEIFCLMYAVQVELWRFGDIYGDCDDVYGDGYMMIYGDMPYYGDIWWRYSS